MLQNLLTYNISTFSFRVHGEIENHMQESTNVFIPI